MLSQTAGEAEGVAFGEEGWTTGEVTDFSGGVKISFTRTFEEGAFEGTFGWTVEDEAVGTIVFLFLIVPEFFLGHVLEM